VIGGTVPAIDPASLSWLDVARRTVFSERL